ncbi:hypothetical protein EI71_00527 [Anaeroplasma bactoclasticum]|uniref:HTH cro/C1-type domain-containing protein n=1 Tax=Anaeroplasma bactoclasticum TaxID=2088 RepID=A0A397S1D3_9MOLU|nr:hypothetical protein [Anaeroplasma bactoclasticum]RIA78215.1 hypothetical protein EI71_00527 [Anaeroplasma bactoclasticum]
MSVMLDILSQRKIEGAIHASNQEIIGIEIRRKRIELSYTLSGLCFDICSPSYLCKIERNQIQANNYILQEICTRVAITVEQQELLFHSYEVLLQSIEAYLKDDMDTILKIVKQGEGFENYRYRIIQLMKYIREDDLYLAKKTCNELLKLLSTMQDLDMVVFSIFTAILEYKEKNYLEAIAILNKLDGINMDLSLSILYSKYLFLTSAILLRGDTLIYYTDIKEKLVKAGYYLNLEEMDYALAIYALKVKSTYLFDYSTKLIHNEVYLNSLKFIQGYQNKDMDLINTYKDKPLNDFCKLLFEILEGNEAKIEMIMHLTSSRDDFDFSANLLKYLALSDTEEKRRFILNSCEYYKKAKDMYVANYFMMELLRINQEKPKNKETVATLYDYFIKNENK